MKRGFIIIFCFVIGILSVILLYRTSQKNNSSKNGFFRTFRSNAVRIDHELDINYNSYYISRLSPYHIYLGNRVVPTHILLTNYKLSDTTHIMLSVQSNDKIAWKSLQCDIDSPNVYLTEYITPSFFNVVLPHKYSNYRNFDSINFDRSIVLSPASFVLRSYNHNLQQKVLKKIMFRSSGIKQANHKLEKQIDGTFCVDGQLYYNRNANILLYMYYYRGNFLRLDSSLHLLYKAKTIDTVSTAQVKVAQLTSTQKDGQILKETTLTAPPVLINKRICASKDYIFVHSALMADNEHKKIFNQSSAIDLYSQVDGKYYFSFYLPNYHDQKLIDFAVYRNTLVAIYDHYLITFELLFH